MSEGHNLQEGYQTGSRTQSEAHLRWTIFLYAWACGHLPCSWRHSASGPERHFPVPTGLARDVRCRRLQRWRQGPSANTRATSALGVTQSLQ